MLRMTTSVKDEFSKTIHEAQQEIEALKVTYDRDQTKGIERVIKLLEIDSKIRELGGLIKAWKIVYGEEWDETLDSPVAD